MDDDAAFIEQCRAAVERRLAALIPDRAGLTRRLVHVSRRALLSPNVARLIEARKAAA